MYLPDLTISNNQIQKIKKLSHCSKQLLPFTHALWIILTLAVPI